VDHDKFNVDSDVVLWGYTH